jgi:hypothetical protein
MTVMQWYGFQGHGSVLMSIVAQSFPSLPNVFELMGMVSLVIVLRMTVKQ